MMVNTPAFREAAALVRDRGQTLGVGLHLNLVVGRPLTAVPTLTDSHTGDFLSLGELARRAMAGRVRAGDVRRECDAQIAALAAEGIAMTHLDSHRHSHALPGILPAVVASARAGAIRIVRRPLDRLLLAEPVVSAKMLALHAAWRVAITGVPGSDRAAFGHVAHFRGIALQGAPELESKLLTLLDSLPGGVTELMLHPGYDDATLAALDPYRAERERELSVLTSGVLGAALDRGAIRLATFAAV